MDATFWLSVGLIYFFFPKVGANMAAYNWWWLVTLGKRGVESEYTNFLLLCIRVVGLIILLAAINSLFF